MDACPKPECTARRIADRTAPAPVLRVPGHWGELLQGRLGPQGPLALVSLPTPVTAVVATLRAAPPPPDGSDLPPGGARLLAALGLARPPHCLALDYGVPRGGGAGSSTAALVALARLAGWQGAPEVLARACVAAEGASDPLMFPDPSRLLFASRRGRVLAALPALPGVEVLGGFLGPGRPTDPADLDFPDIADLAAAWGQGGDAARMAGLAAESARRTLARRGPAGDPTPGLARDLGALGWAIAHTGSARALLFAPGRLPPEAAARLAAEGLDGLQRFRVGG